VDCNTATKFIAKVVRKGIILRDANHFDHIYDEKEEKSSVHGEIVQRIISTMSCCPSHSLHTKEKAPAVLTCKHSGIYFYKYIPFPCILAFLLDRDIQSHLLQ
jgi:hypothetical protein